ncbi:hypothetical protein J4573_34785 [Actinomadura barringtoniae]|uniref:DUF2282 domain-containing protein n=1 Tax=Actinomadura barringtoniae TaxID=1427535 RepID=A0A939T490_9ACTN|nr:hypothetical protein [Actinomadura barringtoniae]MBO2452301.1 hypothetical protein [Actinomadura barringtoniae]
MNKAIAAGLLGVVTVFGAVAAAPAQAAKQPAKQTDCRTYSGVKVCGELKLNAEQKQCVQKEVRLGITERRAEVECFTAVQ